LAMKPSSVAMGHNPTWRPGGEAGVDRFDEPGQMGGDEAVT